MSVFVGIDPGTKGAVAAVADGALIFAEDIPVLTLGKSKRVNGAAVAAYLRQARARGPVRVVIENVASRPGQGGRSIFTFGRSVGAVEVIPQVLGYRWELVTPSQWKRWAGLIGKDKDEARTVAGQRCPGAVSILTRKKDVDRADAILLALWLEEKHGGKGKTTKETNCDSCALWNEDNGTGNGLCQHPYNRGYQNGRPSGFVRTRAGFGCDLHQPKDKPLTMERGGDGRCPDGGACHHLCKPHHCWRVDNSGPLSGVFPGDEWPEELARRL